MNEVKYCPILLIGFDSPAKGKKDMRVCKRDCAWYNSTTEQCCIKDIAEKVETIEESVVELEARYELGYFEEDNWE